LNRKIFTQAKVELKLNLCSRSYFRSSENKVETQSLLLIMFLFKLFFFL